MPKRLPTEIKCAFCQKTFYSTRTDRVVRFCSRLCGARGIALEKPDISITQPCEQCGTPLTFLPGTPRRFCNTSCSALWRNSQPWEWLPEARAKFTAAGQAALSTTPAEVHAGWAQASSERMTAQNPMHNPETREKVSTTLQAMGHRPPVKGGNGQPEPLPQRMLRERLGPAWKTVRVGLSAEVRARFGTEARHYEVDIANPDRRLGVEVDGVNHRARRVRERDKRKDEILAFLGWKIIRMTNDAILSDLEAAALLVATQLEVGVPPPPTTTLTQTPAMPST